jgi:hypothetical protein
MTKYKPVAYDKSIRIRGRNYVATVRMDADVHEFERHSMEEAQKLLACFPDDVFEGRAVTPSVFYRSSRCVTHAI